MSLTPSESKVRNAQDALDLVRRQFMDQMEMRIIELETLFQRCRTAGTTPKECREIRDISHKLAGLAPSLGFSKIGNSARIVETLADTAQQGSGDVTAENPLFLHLEHLLDVMEASLD